MRLTLDHIAVSVADLDAGSAEVEAALGVPLAGGGRHERMGTHNRLLGLGDVYLEVIAIAPDMDAPPHPRWFDLDRFEGAPRVTNWICRTDDLDAMVHRFPHAGRSIALTRGDLRWRMAVPADGRLPFDNCFPALIEWEGEAHPAPRLPEAGCRLKMLTVFHPEAERLAGVLRPMLNEPRVEFAPGPPGLAIEVETPAGLRWL